MTRLLITTLLVIAINVYGSPTSDGTSLSGNQHHSTDLGWLFVPKKHHKYVMDRHEKRSVCESEECKKIARVLRENMDDSVDPCTNFYDYACGNWKKNNPIPKGRKYWNMLLIVQEKVENMTAGILKEENQPDDVLSLKLARKLYKSCMDLDNMDHRGLEPIVSTVARSGGWPMILEPEEYDEDEITWQNIDDYYIRLKGQLTFADVSVMKHPNETIYVPYLTFPDTPLGLFLIFGSDDESNSTEESQESEEKPISEPDSKEKGSQEESSEKSGENSDEEEEGIIKDHVKHEVNTKETNTLDKKKEKYRQFVTQVTMAIAEARGFPISSEKIAEDVEDLIEFMRKMNEMEESKRQRNYMTIKEFQEWYDNLGHTGKMSKINWLHKLSILFENANVEIDENLHIIVPQLDYFRKLAAALDETSPRTIVNYVHWSVCSRLLEATTRKMRKLVSDLITSLSPETSKDDDEDENEDDEMELRNKKCIKEVWTSTMISYEYVKRHFDQTTLTAAKKMIGDIRKEIERQIIKCDWMDEDTKTYALKKAKEMNMLVGYPKWYENKTAVNNYYKGFVISPSYFENLINYAKRKNWKELKLVTQTTPVEPEVEPTTVNALYSEWTNTIVITAADLEGPLFDATRPAMVNFGIIGLIIGHEIGHGFDSNNFGNKIPGMETLSILANKYKKRAECFIEQYNNYFEWDNDTAQDYGNRTSGENIADSMGLEAVYHTYKNREKENGRPEPTLPGFEDFNNDQLFFLSFANMWCETMDENLRRLQLKHDVHSPGMLRVVGPVSNSKEFAEAYNCPVGSRMNPEKKCNIWV